MVTLEKFYDCFLVVSSRYYSQESCILRVNKINEIFYNDRDFLNGYFPRGIRYTTLFMSATLSTIRRRYSFIS